MKVNLVFNLVNGIDCYNTGNLFLHNQDVTVDFLHFYPFWHDCYKVKNPWGPKKNGSSTFVTMPIPFRFLIFMGLILPFWAQSQQLKTYCNPINLDYGYCPIPNFSSWGKHRATADPVIVRYKGDLYLFSTNQTGYWVSSDMSNWEFKSRKFLRPWNTGTWDDLCAPAVGVMGDTMLVFGSTYNRNFSLWMSTNPKANEWKPLVDSFEIGGWDPSFFTDHDGRLYMYNGSSNKYPMYGVELNRKTMQPIGTRKEQYVLESWRYGWQRFGEHMDDVFLDPFIEGSHMTRHKDKYYLQYGAPGTEFSGYADGVLVGPGPMGPWKAQSMPLSFKPGGFSNGAGHGATFQDKWDNYWHVSTQVISVKNNFERRLGIWPTGFDADGHMYMDASFGDYPHYLPSGPADHRKSRFTGWMLLNYQKPVRASSSLNGKGPNFAVDENIKTWWSANSASEKEWFESDLGEASTVFAIQINYADQDVLHMGKTLGLKHRYRILESLDGKKWNVLVDKSNNTKDVPHDYLEVPGGKKTRFLRMENLEMPGGKFALSGFRVFGKGAGSAPDTVKEFYVLRTEKDKRSAWLKWSPVEGAYGYQIYMGPSPDKLDNCILVYSANEYWLKTMDKEIPYFFTIEALNENGVSPRKKIQKVE